MKRHLIFLLSLFLSFNLLIACGGGSDDNDAPAAETADNDTDTGTRPVLADPDFETRLEDDLIIRGRRCEGNETVDGRDCQRDEWIIQVEENGDRERFIAELDVHSVISVPEYTFHEIDPKTSVDRSMRSIINDVWVRTDLNGPTEVVRRN